MEDDICRNNHGGNPESEEANLATRKQRDRDKIINWWKATGDSTMDECEVGLDMRHQTVSPRISELKRDGVLVEISSSEHPGYLRRKTRTGSWARVLRLVV